MPLDIERIPIDKLTLDSELQMREEGINEDVVADYRDVYLTGTLLPPPVVFKVGDQNLVADGFQRVTAASAAGLADLPCQIKQGTRRDALKFALLANAKHGLKRTVADKQKAVKKCLFDEEWGRLSDRQISEMCGVSNQMVSTLRKELEDSGQLSKFDTLTGADGKEYPRERSNLSAKEVKRIQGHLAAVNLEVRTESLGEWTAEERSAAIAWASMALGVAKALRANPDADVKLDKPPEPFYLQTPTLCQQDPVQWVRDELVPEDDVSEAEEAEDDETDGEHEPVETSVQDIPENIPPATEPTPQPETDGRVTVEQIANFRQPYTMLIKRLTALESEAKSLADDNPHFNRTKQQTFSDRIESIKAVLTSIRPKAVCAKCDGAGCASCKECGFLSEELAATQRA